jgi:hypothetical protein
MFDLKATLAHKLGCFVINYCSTFETIITIVSETNTFTGNKIIMKIKIIPSMR